MCARTRSSSSMSNMFRKSCRNAPFASPGLSRICTNQQHVREIDRICFWTRPGDGKSFVLTKASGSRSVRSKPTPVYIVVPHPKGPTQTSTLSRAPHACMCACTYMCMCTCVYVCASLYASMLTCACAHNGSHCDRKEGRNDRTKAVNPKHALSMLRVKSIRPTSSSVRSKFVMLLVHAPWATLWSRADW